MSKMELGGIGFGNTQGDAFSRRGVTLNEGEVRSTQYSVVNVSMLDIGTVVCSAASRRFLRG